MADADLEAAIALTRFGLGARPGEISEIRHDARGWLRAQIRAEGADQPQNSPQTSQQRIAELRDYRQDKKAAKSKAETVVPEGRDPLKQIQRMIRDETGGDFVARAQLGANTQAGFRERWTLFWANHFTVSATKLATATVVGPFEQEAIRPNVFGRFTSLLGAADTHPAMLLYLDQAQSIGPGSMAAQYLQRGKNSRGVGKQSLPENLRHVGLNENLAREILELHTVGVSGGYNQGDVTEFARALTGLSIGGLREPAEYVGTTVFRINTHEPGERTVMGVRYPSGGKEQAAAILADLAEKPATAKYICTKIARHFVTDDPQPALVDRLTQAWTRSRGDLSVVATALIEAPEAWEPTPAKFKTPYEFLISSWRAVGGAPRDIGALAPSLNAMGQKPFSPPSPKGWPEDTDAWVAPDAVVKRMSWAQAFAGSAIADRDPSQLAKDSLGQRLRPITATMIARAESRAEGLALLLMSPEFQRR